MITLVLNIQMTVNHRQSKSTKANAAIIVRQRASKESGAARPYPCRAYRAAECKNGRGSQREDMYNSVYHQ